MRAYFFGNMYLSSIQQGIQAAHCVADMFVKYDTIPGGYVSPQTNDLYDWATNHKTMILLNGGYSEGIRDLRNFFDTDKNPYAWADFHEGNDALDGALTDVGIILPEQIYEGAKQIRENPDTMRHMRDTGQVVWDPDGDTSKPLNRVDISKWEFELMNRINEFRLAS